MRILYLTGREIGYPRNDVILRALQRLGEVEAVAPGYHGGILGRSLQVLLEGLPSLRSNRFDLVFVGFYGHLLMPFVSRLTQSPILFDAFLSTFDTLVNDRKRFSTHSPGGRLARWLDTESCRLANLVLLDTPQHIEYFVNEFRLGREKMQAIPVGCNEEIFFPRPERAGSGITVLYYCSYLPLHGAEFVIRAAGLLRGDASIRFRMIGSGQEYQRVRQLAQDLKLDDAIFVPPVSLSDLSEEIAQAGICLGGHFGQSPKANRVIPGKVYQILAMARPLIASDLEANRSFLKHLESAYLCPAGDAEALAQAVETLARDPDLRKTLALGGRKLYEAKASEAAITAELARLLPRLTR